MQRVTLKPSRCLVLAMIGVHAAAALIVIPLDLPSWAMLSLVALIAASLAHALLRDACLRTSGALVAIELGENDTANVLTRDGEWRKARVLPTTYVTPLLTVINIRVPPRVWARHMVILPDSCDAEDFRKLRVRLRWNFRQEA